MRLGGDVLPDGADPCDHQVTFYEDEQFLIESTVAFLAETLRQGGAGIVVATSDHLEAIRSAVSRLAADLPEGRELGPFVGVDAHEMLDRVMVDGNLDPVAFHAAASEVLNQAPRGQRPHVFGEMVALLWEQGHVTGALALEDLWNDLARARSLELSCAYPIGVFDVGDDAAFRSVCQKHSSVTPAEGYTRLPPDEQARHVAGLQQQLAAAGRERRARQRREAELESSLQRLQQLERLRTEFVAMVVHDIQSPVGVVSATLELLQDAAPADEESRQVLDGASRSTRRIRRLVDDLLLSLQLESGEFTFELRPGDLQGAVARATSDVRAATGRTIELDLPFDLPTVLVDEDRQVQVLTNLLSNAVKFSPPDTEVRVAAEDRGHQVVVHVTNEGEAISADDQAGLFQPFARLRPATPGTGLGLYIARELVAGQGGEIWVTSDEEATTFSYSVVKAPSGARRGAGQTV